MYALSSSLRRTRLLPLVGILASTLAHAAPPPLVNPVSDAIRAQFKLDPFYTQHLDLHGLPIVASKHVRPEALREAAWVLTNTFGHRSDIFAELGRQQVRLCIMSHLERTTDVPEHSDLTPAAHWDRRARGLGPTPQRPAVSGAEENILCFKGDPYSTENILIHEFAHAVHLMALNKLDPTFDNRLKKAFDEAKAKKLWDCYAGSNKQEYWAEAVQSYINNNRENDNQHNHVNTRAELKTYDPGVYALCKEILGPNPPDYIKPWKRPAKDRRHLGTLRESDLPSFSWDQRLPAKQGD